MDGVNDCLKEINREAAGAEDYEKLKDKFVVSIFSLCSFSKSDTYYFHYILILYLYFNMNIISLLYTFLNGIYYVLPRPCVVTWSLDVSQ